MTAAVFGKLPAHGDFIARGLARDEVDEIDAWLAQSLAEARQQLGPAFEHSYDHAPPWRFAGAGVAGALAPSVDAVGRRFPILVLRTGLADGEVAAAAEACESLLFDALGQGWTADRLAEAVAAIAPETGGEWNGDARWWTEGGEEFAPTALPGRRPRAILRAVLTMESPE